MDINEAVQSVQKVIDELASGCETQAAVLVKNFRYERINKQREWFKAMSRFGSSRGSHSIGTWCPLNLFFRLHNGSLQIYWQLVYRDRFVKKVGFKHLAKRNAGGYDLRQLLGHAHDFERTLVREYEEEAQLQRQRWACLMKLKHDFARLQEIDGVESAYIKRRHAEQDANKLHDGLYQEK